MTVDIVTYTSRHTVYKPRDTNTYVHTHTTTRIYVLYLHQRQDDYRTRHDKTRQTAQADCAVSVATPLSLNCASTFWWTTSGSGEASTVTTLSCLRK